MARLNEPRARLFGAEEPGAAVPVAETGAAQPPNARDPAVRAADRGVAAPGVALHLMGLAMVHARLHAVPAGEF